MKQNMQNKILPGHSDSTPTTPFSLDLELTKILFPTKDKSWSLVLAAGDAGDGCGAGGCGAGDGAGDAGGAASSSVDGGFTGGTKGGFSGG